MPIINEDLIVQEYKDKTKEELEKEMVWLGVKISQLGEPCTKKQCFEYSEVFAQLGVLLEMMDLK